MRNLSDIIEDCKLNKQVENAELKYSVLSLTGLLNLAVSVLNDFYTKDESKKEFNMFDKMRIENIHKSYHTALNKSPKEWLGWNNDPENPDYQAFHAMGSKLVDKALKGELPNQKGEKR